MHAGASGMTSNPTAVSQSQEVAHELTDPQMLLYELTNMAQQEPPIKINGQFVLEALGPDNPKKGGQSLVWFARGADNTGLTFAIKFFYSAATMRREMDSYSDAVCLDLQSCEASAERLL